MNDSPKQHLAAVAFFLAFGLAFGGRGIADQAAAQNPAAKQPAAKTPNKIPDASTLARFITVRSPVEDSMSGKVKNLAIALQHQAVKENRPAFLVLEITPGTSEFHHIQGLAKFLISSNLNAIKTIAWIPEKVTGNNVVLALACNEIVMHPDAELGDIGRGETVDPVDRQFVVSIVDNRHNIKVNRALAIGMMDPQRAIWKIQTEEGEPGQEHSKTDFVTQEELEQQQKKSKTVIKETRIIWESGEIGLTSGRGARDNEFLVTQTAESRGKLAEQYNLPRESLREDATAGAPPRARLIRIEGMIEPILEDFVDREIRRSIAARANLIIFEIDSPGGYLLSSTNLAHTIADLNPKQVRTVAYVPKMALSGAAIIALGCDEIYMHPYAQIGDAGPIEMKEGGQFEHAPEKILGHLRETLAALAEKKGRPPALAEAMADKDLKVFQVTNAENGRVTYMSDDDIHESHENWIKGRLVPESKESNLLTINGSRAHDLQLAEPPVEDLADLKQRLGIPPKTVLLAAKRTWVDTLVFVLNTRWATFLLFVAGAVCIYFELYTMTGLFGIASAVCFAVFFWSRFLGGTAGWLEIILFMIGLACIAMEVFVIPGFGVFGISGGLLILVSLILASQTYVVPQTGPQFDDISWTLGTLSAAVVSVIALAMVMSRYLPQMPILNKMILAPPHSAELANADEPQLRPEFASGFSPIPFGQSLPGLMHQQGTAVSDLRPAGKARIGEQLVDVVSDGPYISTGGQIQVIDVEGNRVVVREV